MSAQFSDFSSLGLSDALLKALKSAGYTTPTPIQQEAIPALLEGEDIIGQAKTGTGKTAAFALPLLQRINFDQNTSQILVLAPTRELAIQVAAAFEGYAQFMPHCKVACIYGGDGYIHQKALLKAQAKIIVGTTGRIIDHIKRGSFNPATLSAVVLDEADEMLRMGFIDDVNFILKAIPNKCQMALFSATMPRSIQELAKTYLSNPRHIKIESQQTTTETIEQQFLIVNSKHKINIVSQLLELENTSGAIIFVRTRRMAIELTETLQNSGFKCAALHGELTQKDRERTVGAFKDHKYEALIATDIAARGLDIERICLVVNFDMPDDDESYIHRIGRTGRAGRMGKAIALIGSNEMYRIRNLERRYKINIQRFVMPEKEAIHDMRVKRFSGELDALRQHPAHKSFKALAEQLCQELDIEISVLTELLLSYVNQQKPFDPPSLPDMQKSLSSKPRPRERSKKLKAFADQRMRCYRLDVGKKHNVKVGNIVGAIANEAGIENRHIGQIKLFNDYSLIDLPEGMPNQVFSQLQNTRVCGRKLKIAEWTPAC